MKKEYKKSWFLFDKLKREEGFMDNCQQTELLREVLESLMKQLPVAINEVQSSEAIEQKVQANHQSLIDALNQFKKDLSDDIMRTQSYTEGITHKYEKQIGNIISTQQDLIRKIGTFEARMSTLASVGGAIVTILSLVIGWLSLQK